MKRLYKSRKDRVIAGVCGGVGEYFEIDPVLIRIIWALLAILGGSGIIAYIIGMIIIPERPKEDIPDDFEVEEERKNNRKTSQTVWGIILIGIGLIVLFQQFPLF
ncbi:MAG: PspC domain-containing protein, partial [Candidatus Marinimicrobia bacterium]|nr:PspC domain-containing protein [Candidatus Neomarinimicrobiota bacterium]